ncbi:Tim44 domain-containing protein [Acuticoccus sp. I52.16.1]|uniref:Tim44 domain-containing protein n=1 Tax=Acuticoccus sp. I52.16.1 TaxID=2928472 RepID=UPI001FD186C1|nr:Tim44 domain-containing protein [Acuticoccus sp. I52.16.1]UOM34208.1 Tim44 domain-containing protein [Acuticoccus sp. I52.16.1]
MRFFHSLKAVLALAVIALSVSFVAVDYADARRGGSFGSRGARTYSRPAPTTTAPSTTSPINRSMTPRTQASPSSQAARGAAQQGRRGMFGGLAGGLLGGLMLGGLIGMLMGNGLGGMAGFLGLILQVGIAILVVSLIMRWFRSRQQPSFAGSGGGTPRASAPPEPDMSRNAYESAPMGASAGAGMGSGTGHDMGTAPTAAAGGDELGLTAEDYDAFEQLLVEVQAAFTREDYAGLRERCTPEIVSYLSEELSQNAVSGVKNDVVDVKLLEGDLAESWREDGRDYATVAMRYESIDVMRDRQTGEIREGDSGPTETTEIWTFVRPAGGRWQLSAIQQP